MSPDHAAQEPTSATAHVHVEEHGFRVTTWTLPPGEATGWHRHEVPYAVVPLTDGLLRIESADGAVEAVLTAGQPYARPAGAEHDVRNAGAETIVFVEVERTA